MSISPTARRLRTQITFNHRLKEYGDVCRLRGMGRVSVHAVEHALVELKEAKLDLIAAAKAEGAAASEQG